MSLDDLAEEIHATAREKGFWRDEHERSFDAQRIALIHSELSECLEELRSGAAWLSPREELADALIRILDFAAGKGWSMDKAVQEKMEKNRARPHLHGKAF